MDVTEAAGLGGLSIHPHNTAPRHTAIHCILFLILVRFFFKTSQYIEELGDQEGALACSFNVPMR